jgi:mRNA-degrading endonuclease RelE of RelBE toxin-antitoxin system
MKSCSRHKFHPMNYRIVFIRRSAKDISKLDPEIKEKIGDALKRYTGCPKRSKIAIFRS